MYAVIETGSKQYRVTQGDRIKVEKLDVAVGDEILLEDILAIHGDDGITFGTPIIEGAKVKAVVVDQAKHDKVIIFKYLPKKDFRKKKGHRQPYTELEIKEIIK